MVLDLRLQQKMVQQLVMTPQLQQAIKLLQLSHMEMTEVLQTELDQNPVLEDPEDREEGDVELSPEEPFSQEIEERSEAELGPSVDANEQSEIAEDITTVLSETPNDATPEPSSKEVDQDVDWGSYLDTYSYSLPAVAGSAGNEELPPFDANLTKPTTLHDHLRWQLHMANLDQEQKKIANLLIEEINEDGYLSEDALEVVARELEVGMEDVESVLAELQTFDPTGIAARNLKECLLLQVRRSGSENPLIVTIIEKHLHEVENRNLSVIARSLGIATPEVIEAIQTIARLEPRPGRVFNEQAAHYITPDIYVHKIGQDYTIVLNEDGLPKLRISNYYRNALQQYRGSTKSFVQDKLRNAVWLIRSIHMRQRTIYRVMESVLKFQRDFFDKGVTQLKPLVLKDVAEDIGMHESTVSRVTTNKYVHTPQGIFELKFFFNSSIHRTAGEAIASESVRNHIQQLVAEENPKNPYSDQELVNLLKKNNIEIARRTVAKYREMLKIPPSGKRKQYF